MKQLRLVALTPLLVGLTLACSIDYRFVGEREAAPRGTERIAWEPYLPGIDLAHHQMEDPPQRLYFVRVDLGRPGVSVTTTPPNGERPLEVDGMRTTTFLRRSGADLAINASQFRPVEQEEFAPKDIAGLAVYEGRRYSPDEGSQDVIAFTANGLAVISGDTAGMEGIRTAVAGRPVVLDDGAVGSFGPARHPRTAVGVSADGRMVYIVVAEGRMGSRSIGLTLSEVGLWLRLLGAADGLNLDGGGSSTLVIRDAAGEPMRVNRTVHNPILGNERVVANHLGIVVKE
ncbi:MAG: phosphodiester glycosidase family protein [Spirochaetaceae bacterium]